MSKLFKYYKSNIITGCRLADIDKTISKDEVFYLDAHIASTSRSVSAAEKAKWIIEITEKEASQFISLPHPKIALNPVQKIPQKQKQPTVNNKMNDAALKRQQERLKKIEQQNKEEEEVVIDEVDEKIEPGKNTETNIAALQRIRRRKNAKKVKVQEDAYLKEVGETVTESNIIKEKIQKNFRKTTDQKKVDLLIDKEAKSKELIKADIDSKLNQKIAEKQAEKQEEVIEKPRRGRPKKVEKQEDFIATPTTEVTEVEPKVKRRGRPKKEFVETKAILESIVEPKPEKKRGRKPKVDKVEVVETKPIEVETVEVKSKRRGRPKKVKEIIESTTIEKPKRRGRPKKEEVKIS